MFRVTALTMLSCDERIGMEVCPPVNHKNMTHLNEPASSPLVFPPGPKRGFPILNYFRFRSNTLLSLQKMAAEFGDIVYFKLGPQAAYFLNHPDYIRDVLVTSNNSFMKGRALQRSKRLLGEGLLTSENPLHRRQRRLAQPAFHRQRIASYADIMTSYPDKIMSG